MLRYSLLLEANFGSVFLIKPSCICSLWHSYLFFQFEHGYSETWKKPHYSFVIWAPNENKAQRTNLCLHSQCVRLSLRCSGAKRQEPEYSNSLDCLMSSRSVCGTAIHHESLRSVKSSALGWGRGGGEESYSSGRVFKYCSRRCVMMKSVPKKIIHPDIK